MKITIDVHSLGKQAGGNETFYRELVRGLLRDQTRNEYELLHTHPFSLQGLQNDPRFTLRKIPKNPFLRLGLAIPLLLQRSRPDVFHCQYIQPLWGKHKTVVTIHDLAFENHPEFFAPAEMYRMKRLVPRTAWKSDHIITVSEFSAADIERRYGVPRRRITVVYQAPAPEFRPLEKQFCTELVARNYGVEAPFLLYVGRIQARKNLGRLVEAYARVRKKGSEARLVMVGKKDWQSEQLLARIRELGLEDAVVFPGFVELKDLPAFYGAAEAFVYPSIFEGFGLPVVESMACGTPTITSHGSSLEEVAGYGALLVDALSVDSISSALERVLGDADLRAQLSSRGIRRAQQFSRDDLKDKTLAVYRSLA